MPSQEPESCLEATDRLARWASTQRLLSDIKNRSASLYIDPVDDERFYFSPAAELTPSLRAALANHKPEILSILRRYGHSDQIDFGLVTREKESFVLRFREDADIVAAALRIGAKPAKKLRRDNTEHAYVVATTLGVVDGLINLCVDFAFEVDHSVMETCHSLAKEGQDRLENSHAADSDFRVPGLGKTLRPFQRAGVKYVVATRRVMVGDDMGLGKTPTGLASLKSMGTYPAIIVCPASLKLNWAKEAIVWTPDKTLTVIDSTAKKPFRVSVEGTEHLVKPNDLNADIIIVNYELLHKWFDKLRSVHAKAFVFDESHLLKSRDAKRTKAAAGLVEGCDVRIMLTGTPILNRPIELASQLEILGRIDEFGGYWTYAKQYCDAQRGPYGWITSGSSNLEQLNRLLRATCFIRRTKAEVLKELPPKQRVTIPIQISNMKEYAAAQDDVSSWLADQKTQEQEFKRTVAALHPSDREQFLKQHKEGVKRATQHAEQLLKFEALKQIALKGKIDTVYDWIDNFLQSGEKLVVFAHHVAVVKGIARRYNAPHITGDTPLTDRQAAVDRFQKDPACPLIVLNLQAGGVGHTLTAASNVAFIELGWNPATMDQAEDRCNRMGQQNSVTCWYFIAEGTIEQEIAEMIERKRRVVTIASEGDREAAESILTALVAKLLAAKAKKTP